MSSGDRGEPVVGQGGAARPRDRCRSAPTGPPGRGHEQGADQVPDQHQRQIPATSPTSKPAAHRAQRHQHHVPGREVGPGDEDQHQAEREGGAREQRGQGPHVPGVEARRRTAIATRPPNAREAPARNAADEHPVPGAVDLFRAHLPAAAWAISCGSRGRHRSSSLGTSLGSRGWSGRTQPALADASGAPEASGAPGTPVPRSPWSPWSPGVPRSHAAHRGAAGLRRSGASSSSTRRPGTSTPAGPCRCCGEARCPRWAAGSARGSGLRAPARPARTRPPGRPLRRYRSTRTRRPPRGRRRSGPSRRGSHRTTRRPDAARAPRTAGTGEVTEVVVPGQPAPARAAQGRAQLPVHVDHPSRRRRRTRPGRRSCTGSTTRDARRSLPSSRIPPTTRWPASRGGGRRPAAGHPEHRRPARVRRLPTGGPHARRAAVGPVPRVPRGGCPGSTSSMTSPRARGAGRRAAPRRRVVRRDPRRDGPDPRGARPWPTCSSRSVPPGAVYPAAGFVQVARVHGARTLELNLQPSEGTTLFHEPPARAGRPAAAVSVDELLAP